MDWGAISVGVGYDVTIGVVVVYTTGVEVGYCVGAGGGIDQGGSLTVVGEVGNWMGDQLTVD